MTEHQIEARIAKRYAIELTHDPRYMGRPGSIGGVPLRTIVHVLESADLTVVDRELFEALVAAVRTREEFRACPAVDAITCERAAYRAHLGALIALSRGESGE